MTRIRSTALEPSRWDAVVRRVRSAATAADEARRRESSLRRVIGSSFHKAVGWVADAAAREDWVGKAPRFNSMQPSYLYLIAHRLIERDDDIRETGVGLSIALAGYWVCTADGKRTEIGVRAVQSMAAGDRMWAEFFLQEMSWKDRCFDGDAEVRSQGEYVGDDYGIDDVLAQLVQGVLALYDWQANGHEGSRYLARMHAGSVIDKLATAKRAAAYERHPALARFAVRIQRRIEGKTDEAIPAWALWVKNAPMETQLTPDEILKGARPPIRTKIDEPAGGLAGTFARRPLTPDAARVIEDVTAAISSDDDPFAVTCTILEALRGYWDEHPFGVDVVRALERMEERNISALISSGAELAGIVHYTALDYDRDLALISFMHHLARAGMYYRGAALATSRPVKLELLGRGGARGAITVAHDIMSTIDLPPQLITYVKTLTSLVDTSFDEFGGGSDGGGNGNRDPLPPSDERPLRRKRGPGGITWRTAISVAKGGDDVVEAPSLNVFTRGLQLLNGLTGMSLGQVCMGAMMMRRV